MPDRSRIRQVFLLVGVLFLLAVPVWAGTVTVTPIAVALGGTITVTAAGLAPNDGTILALIPQGAPDNSYADWAFLTGNKTTRSGVLTGGTWTVRPLAVGIYDVRAMHWAGTGYAADVISAPVGVVATIVVPPPPPPPVATAKLTAQSVTVTVTGGPGGALDWLGLFLASAPDTTYLDWARMNGTKSTPATGATTGTATFAIPLTGGPWEIRLLSSDGKGKYTRVAVISRIEAMP